MGEEQGEYVKRVLFRQRKWIETPEGAYYLEATLWKFYRREGETVDAGVIPVVAIWRVKGRDRYSERETEWTEQAQSAAGQYVLDFWASCCMAGKVPGFQP
jgi:hypothetical protein